jgi:membrane-associated protease RseP (regulator of RpoE activity)
VTKWALAALCYLTLSVSGAWHALLFIFARDHRLISLWSQEAWSMGQWYAVAMLVIMLCHEYGHMVAVSRYHMQTTGPYFLPAPWPMTGTMGSFLRLHGAFPSREALVEVGAAGPLGGMVVIIPAVMLGLAWSVPAHLGSEPLIRRFGEPLLFQAFGIGGDVALHPLAVAGWFGCLLTSINLLPFLYLDGGRIIQGLAPNLLEPLSVVVWLGCCLGVFLDDGGLSWLLLGIVLLAQFIYAGSPPPPAYLDPPSWRASVWASLAAACAVLCWCP